MNILEWMQSRELEVYEKRIIKLLLRMWHSLNGYWEGSHSLRMDTLKGEQGDYCHIILCKYTSVYQAEMLALMHMHFNIKQ